MAALDDPFWDAARDGRLVVQRCDRCSTAFWPPVQRCGECAGESGLEWVEVEPVGRVWSYAIYHRIFDQRLALSIPYAVVAVELDAGVCLPGRLVSDHEALTVGSWVEAKFEELDETTIGPVWELKEQQ